ncbi:minichromosome maintenance 8 factor recombination-defective isoform X2 [Rhodnius prolixus]|uniref:minichromosome maintenance 8 factor recombination-defective isoform X2 n=1 Tax=Rhodnius prolixus TaxID=13249 RepID=UPI003D189927
MATSKRGGRGSYRGRPWFMKKKVPTVINEEDVIYNPVSNEPDIDRIPYKGWNHYFPDEVYESISQTTFRTRVAENFFSTIIKSLKLSELEEHKYYRLDSKILLNDEALLKEWPSFPDDIRDNPSHTINCLGLALHQVACKLDGYDPNAEFPAIRIRLINFEPVVPLKDIKAGLFGKLVTVKGTVIRVGPAKLLCVRMGFACTSCRRPQTVIQKDGVYSLPKSCISNECKSRNFAPLCSSHLTITRNFQVIKIQESVGDSDNRVDGGRVPRTIEIELTDDLVDVCCPGDNVTVTGIVKVNSSEENQRKKTANLFILYIEGVSIVTSKGSGGRLGQNNVEFSLKDYYAIQELHEEQELFRLLVNSVCPTVYGHEAVKAGVLLSLVGGAQGAGRRPNIHVLIVGDPGLGKSHMLHACASVAPRGVYVCGNTTSSSGLTVTLTKEQGGDFALEAGALVLANHGVCCIDEFDKMTSQHQYLDSLLSEHVMALHAGPKKMKMYLRSALSSSVSSDFENTQERQNISLVERLKIRPGENIDLVPQELLRKYIAYVRKYVPTPKLSEKAGKILQKFYLELRMQHRDKESTPVTTRQLESMIRLTEARAKVELREEATEEDANDVVELMKLTLIDIYDDGKGVMDFKRSHNGSGMSQASKGKRFISALQRRAQLENKNTFYIDEMKELCSIMNLQVTDFTSFIEILNTQGFIIKKSSNQYKLLTV